MSNADDQLRDAIAAAGIDPPAQIVRDGQIHRFTTNGRPSDNAGWYVIRDDGSSSFGDFRSGVVHHCRPERGVRSNVFDIERMRSERAARDDQRKVADQGRKRLAAAIWNPAVEPANTAAERYLQGRGLVLPDTQAVRFVPDLPHRDGGTFPAMVSLVQSVDGAMLGIHRTFLAAGGAGKADVKPAKMMLGRTSGGAVRLCRDVGSYLMVGEGIESTLSVMQETGRPGWAALSAGGMESLLLPKSVREVLILADGDPRGEQAATKAATRFVREGRTVRIARPPPGLDFNDVLLARSDEVRA